MLKKEDAVIENAVLDGVKTLLGEILFTKGIVETGRKRLTLIRENAKY